MIGAIIAGATALIPVISRLIHGVEDSIGPGQGTKKKNLVTEGAAPTAKELKSQGILPDDFNVGDVADLVQTVFDVLRGVGILKERKAPPATEALESGEYTITISGKATIGD